MASERNAAATAAKPRSAGRQFEDSVRGALSVGDVVAARSLAEETAEYEWTSELRRILAQPSARVLPMAPEGRADTGANLQWLREHGDEHKGRWVALNGGALLGADTDPAALRRSLASQGILTDAVFVRLD